MAGLLALLRITITGLGETGSKSMTLLCSSSRKGQTLCSRFTERITTVATPRSL
uniref:Uncharacterized protein n=1 Tax=Rhizophora mucronata TaxID=61149 RepID=A0A2P2ISZ6_RHIMU